MSLTYPRADRNRRFRLQWFMLGTVFLIIAAMVAYLETMPVPDSAIATPELNPFEMAIPNG